MPTGGGAMPKSSMMGKSILLGYTSIISITVCAKSKRKKVEEGAVGGSGSACQALIGTMSIAIQCERRVVIAAITSTGGCSCGT